MFDQDAYNIHIKQLNDSSTSDSGKSFSDEELNRLKPKPLKINPKQVVVIESQSRNYIQPNSTVSVQTVNERQGNRCNQNVIKHCNISPNNLNNTKEPAQKYNKTAPNNFIDAREPLQKYHKTSPNNFIEPPHKHLVLKSESTKKREIDPSCQQINYTVNVNGESIPNFQRFKGRPSETNSHHFGEISTHKFKNNKASDRCLSERISAIPSTSKSNNARSERRPAAVSTQAEKYFQTNRVTFSRNISCRSDVTNAAILQERYSRELEKLTSCLRDQTTGERISVGRISYFNASKNASAVLPITPFYKTKHSEINKNIPRSSKNEIRLSTADNYSEQRNCDCCRCFCKCFCRVFCVVLETCADCCSFKCFCYISLITGVILLILYHYSII